MDTRGKAIRILGDEKRVVSRKFTMLLEDLIVLVDSGDFDPKIFSERYLELLSCVAQIFELEKNFYGITDKRVLHQSVMPYRALSAQLANLNEKCCEKGILHSSSMLEFLLNWFSKRGAELDSVPDNRDTKASFAFAC